MPSSALLVPPGAPTVPSAGPAGQNDMGAVSWQRKDGSQQQQQMRRVGSCWCRRAHPPCPARDLQGRTAWGPRYGRERTAHSSNSKCAEWGAAVAARRTNSAGPAGQSKTVRVMQSAASASHQQCTAGRCCCCQGCPLCPVRNLRGRRRTAKDVRSAASTCNVTAVPELQDGFE